MRILKLFFSALLLLVLLPATNSYAAVCTTTSGSVVFPTGGSCSYEPTTYSITLYKVGLCASAPTAPTPTSAAGLSSCTTVYENTAGAAVSVSSTGAPVALSGGVVTLPPAGAYGYGYAILSNTIGVSTSVTFSASKNGQVSGSGAVCWTVNLDQTIYAGSNVTSSCGSSVGSVGTMNIKVDSFDPSPDETYTQTLSVVGTNDLKVYILEPSGVSFADTTALSGVSNRILGIQTFTTPVTVPAESTSFDAAFKSSTGLTIIDAGSGVVKFSGGPFAAKFTVK